MFVNNYGWDWDTYAMLETFIKLKKKVITSDKEVPVIYYLK